MATINTSALIETCDTLARRCIKLADTYHGSAWLFDKLMRAFENSPATVAITIPVYIGSPVMKPGEATICRDGSLQMHTI